MGMRCRMVIFSGPMRMSLTRSRRTRWRSSTVAVVALPRSWARKPSKPNRTEPGPTELLQPHPGPGGQRHPLTVVSPTDLGGSAHARRPLANPASATRTCKPVLNGPIRQLRPLLPRSGAVTRCADERARHRRSLRLTLLSRSNREELIFHDEVRDRSGRRHSPSW